MLLLVGAHSLGCGKGRFIYKTYLCQLCHRYVEESVSHFLLDCPGLQEMRSGLIDNVLNVMPQGMVASWRAMSIRRKTEFLLCDMGRTRTSEWREILVPIVELAYSLYKERDRKLKSVTT